MTVERLTEAKVRQMRKEDLVGAFEVCSRQAFDPANTIEQQRTASKNLDTLRQEIFGRMSH